MQNKDQCPAVNPQLQLPQVDTESHLKSGLNVVRYGAEAGIVAAEATPVPPINEMIRFGAMAWAIAKGYDPVIVAGVSGAATLAIEAPAAAAAADLFDSPVAARTTQRLNNTLEKLHIPRDAKMNGLMKAGAAYLGGSAVVTWLRHREDAETRTRRDNLPYGLRAATALAGVTAVQGFLVAEGFSTPNPLTVGGGLMAIGGGVAAGKYFAVKIRRDNSSNKETSK